jgi:flagellar basal-body rod modification protein FlgD
MEINPSATAAVAAASTTGKSLAKNFDTFLTLLTTQLKNQDPLEPLKTESFTQQLVQFSGVEQAIGTNQRLDELLNVYRSGYAANLVNYIGRTVSAKGAVTSLTAGQASWKYELPAAAASVTLNVYDQADKLVWTGAGAATAGTHTFNWDGTNSAGLPMPEGIHRIQVKAKDAAGSDIAAQSVIRGVVTGIEAVGGVTFVDVDGQKVPLGDVLAIHETPVQNPV